jgi:hypothetical protein
MHLPMLGWQGGGGGKGKGFQTKFCVKFPTSGIQVPGQIDRTQRQLKLF